MFSQNNGFYNMPENNISPSAYPNSVTQYPSNYQFQQDPFSYQQNNSLRNNYAPAYGSGGAVNLHDMAEKVREAGDEEDSILAHINPMEQQLLKQHGGSGTINPRTGLPEYGFLKKLGRVLAPIVGTFLGGPLGGIAASAALGASERGKGNKLKGALKGGLQGLGYTALAPMLGNAFGINPSGFAGQAMGLAHPSLLSQLGMGGAGGQLGGGIGLGNLMGGAGAGGATAMEQGAQSGAGKAGGFFGNLSPLQLGLGATAIGGTLLGKTKQPKEESLQEYMQRNSIRNSAEGKPKKYKYEREYAAIPEDYIGMEQGEIPYFTPGKWTEEPYAYGGAIRGATNGQDDKIPAALSDGEYVHKADFVSRLGDGNTNAGFLKLEKLEDIIMKNKPRTGRGLPKKSPDVKGLMRILGV